MNLRFIRQRPSAPALVLVALLAACGAETPQQQVEKGKAELARREPQAALIHFMAALLAQPDDVATRVLLGRALAESGDTVGAAVELTRALEQKADPAQAVPLLAAVLVATGQARRVVDTFGAAVLADKAADAEFRTHLAAAYATLRNMPKARETLRAALEANPQYARAHLLQARFAMFERQYASALVSAEAALAIDPQMAPAVALKGEALLRKDDDQKGAQAAALRTIELDPTLAAGHLLLMHVHTRRGDTEGLRRTLAAFEKAAPNNPELVFASAQLAYVDKDFRRARELIQQLLKVEPENPNLLQLAAAVEWNGGSLPIAQKMLETAVRVDPELEVARINLAHISNLLGQPGRALTALAPLLNAEGAHPSALAAAGEAALKMGDGARAEGYYRRAVERSPGDERAQTSLALAQLDQGNTAAGLAALQTLAPQSKEGYVESALASAFLAQGDLASALAAAEGVVRKRPNDASAHELVGRVLMGRRDDPAARAAFERALALEPRSLSAVAALVELDVLQGKPEAGRARAEAFIGAEPANRAAVTALAEPGLKAGVPLKEVEGWLVAAIQAAPEEPAQRIKLVDLLAGQRQIKRALSVAQEAAAALPNDLQVLDALGRMLWADGNTQQALVSFRKMLSIEPNMAAAHVRMAGVHMADGNTSAAVASLRRAVEIEPRQRAARQQLVTLLVDAKRTKEALEIAADLQKREPRSAGGYLLEGAIHRKALDHFASAQAYRRGLDRAADQAELALNYFVALLAAKNWKVAESFALEWLAKHPADGAVTYNLAEGYLLQRDLKSAEKYFSRAAEMKPDHVPSLNNVADMRVKLGKPGALDFARRAFALEPRNPAVLDTLASALVDAGNPQEAMQHLKAAVQLAPSEPLLRLNLAKLALKLGDSALAKAELTRVVGAVREGPVRSEADRLLGAL
jgi:putative PEP-CTERM system TPR-repeat lipoprotein